MQLTNAKFLQKGIEAHRTGNLKEAYHCYSTILESEPKHPDANHNMGSLAVSVGKIKKALPFFRNALAADLENSHFWLSYIRALISMAKMQNATIAMELAKSCGVKGDEFDQMNEKIKASKDSSSHVQFEQAVNQKNVLENLTLDQAINSILEKLDTETEHEAKRIYQHILTKFSNNKEAVANINRRLGIVEGNFQKWREPSNSQLKEIISLCNQDQSYDALELCQGMIMRYTTSATLWNIKGTLIHRLGCFNLSVTAFKKAIKFNPDFAEAFNNMGCALKDQGKLFAAIKAYQRAIYLSPNYTNAYFNLGNTLQEQRKWDTAVDAYLKALSTRSDFPEAFNNMGNALQSQKKWSEAIDAYTSAISLKADFADAYYNIGNVLHEQCKWEEAICEYRKALSIKPNYTNAYFNMGNTLLEQYKWEQAIDAFTRALNIEPSLNEAYYNISKALKYGQFKAPNPTVEAAIISILDRKTVIRPSDVSSAAISLIKTDPKLKPIFSEEFNYKLHHSFNEMVTLLSESTLLLKFMRICPLADLDIEKALSQFRSFILLNISSIKVTASLLKVQSALALHCHTNEYLYNLSDSEIKVLDDLENSISHTISKGNQPDIHLLLCLSSFKSLHTFDWCDLLLRNPDVEDVMKRQIDEPKEEIKIKFDFTHIDQITNKVSNDVREQYERNPYPRWINAALRKSPSPISEITNEISLKLSDIDIHSVDTPDILIAGCGTGQQSIETAARFKGSKVLAIDLSLSSLAYAKRKTREFGLTNLEYMQGDILSLQKLNRKFDIIESTGVLHHMEDPMSGWRVLVDCLRPGGLIKIGLYSELARTHIAKIRNEASLSSFEYNNKNIRSFREKLIQSREQHHKLILKSADFYSLSTMRDLTLHIQEHQFTLSQIQKCIHQLELEFCGFEGNMLQAFKSLYPQKDSEYDLCCWNEFEQNYPRVFAGMYQFWCQKIS